MISDQSKPLLYFAAPLFSDGEREFNQKLTRHLERWFDVYLPQRDGGLFTDLVRRGVEVTEASVSIFRRDCDALRESTICLAVLDGRAIDEGAAFELGIAYSLGKVCIGLQTDSRRLLPIGNNPMIQCALQSVFLSTNELLQWADRFAATHAANQPLR